MQKAVLTGHDLIIWLLQILTKNPSKDQAVLDWAKNAQAYLDQHHSPGANLIETERLEQLEKHGFSLPADRKHTGGELWKAALYCLTGSVAWWPDGWDLNMRNKIGGKGMQERLAIAGALLAAEIDRLLEYEQPGGTFTSLTPAALVAKEAIRGQVFEATLVQLAGTNDFWAGALQMYKTGTRPKPTAAQRLGEVITGKLAGLPDVDGVDIDVLAQAAVDGIGAWLANQKAPATPGGMETVQADDKEDPQAPAVVDVDATLRTQGEPATGKK